MATNEELKRAALREMARRELARRAEGGAVKAAPPVEDTSWLSKAGSSISDAASAGVDWAQEKSVPLIGKILGDKPSPARYAAALAYQGANPFTAGAVGQEALMDNPVAQQSALMMEENATDALGPKYGPAFAAYGQSLTQMLPGALATSGVGLGVSAPKALATTGLGLLKQGAIAGAKGAAGAAAENAASATLGAHTGQRTQAAIEAAQDPVALAMGGIPAVASATLGSIRQSRAMDRADARADALADVRTELNVSHADAVAASVDPTTSPMLDRAPVTGVHVNAEVPTKRYEDGLNMLNVPHEVREPILVNRVREMEARLPPVVEAPLGRPAELAGRSSRTRLAETQLAEPATSVTPSRTMNQRVKPLSAEGMADLPSLSAEVDAPVPFSLEMESGTDVRRGLREGMEDVDGLVMPGARGTSMLGAAAPLAPVPRTQPLLSPGQRMLSEGQQVASPGQRAAPEVIRVTPEDIELGPKPRPHPETSAEARAQRWTVLINHAQVRAELALQRASEFDYVPPAKKRFFTNKEFAAYLKRNNKQFSTPGERIELADADQQRLTPAQLRSLSVMEARNLAHAHKDYVDFEKVPKSRHRVSGGARFVEGEAPAPMRRADAPVREESAIISMIREPDPVTGLFESSDAYIITGKDPRHRAPMMGGSGPPGSGPGASGPFSFPTPGTPAHAMLVAQAKQRAAQINQVQLQSARLNPRSVQMAPPPRPPGPMPKHVATPAAVQQLANKANIKDFDPREGRLAKIGKELLLPEFRAQAEAAEAIRGWRAAVHMHNEQVARTHPQVQQAYKKASPAGRALIDKFMVQHLDKQAITIPESALPAEFRNLYRKGMDQMERQRLDLAKSGHYTQGELNKMIADQKAGIQWLHRDYRAYQDKGWKPRKDVSEAALDYIVKKSGGKLDRTGATKELDALFNGDGGSIEQRFLRSTLNTGILKARGHIPPVLREALGVIKDPAYLVANSMGEMERMWRQYRVSAQFVTPEFKGRVWDDNPNNPLMGTHKIYNEALSPEQNKKMFGEFAGKYVVPQLHEAIMQMPMAKKAGFDIFKAIIKLPTAAMKTAKIPLAPISWVTNWFGNAAPAAASGLPWWNAKKFSGRMTQSAKALLAYSNTFETMKSSNGKRSAARDAQWVQWALEDSALIGGMGAEFGGSKAKQIAARFLRDSKGGPAGFFSSGLQMASDAKATLGGWYDNVDSHWRLAVYIEQVTKGRERLGLSMPEARGRAARIVNANFASSGSVGNAVKTASGYGGIMAPFMTWHADNIRTHLNWAHGIKKGVGAMDQQGARIGGMDLNAGEGAGQALNVAIHHMAIAGLFEGMRRLYNFTDQDVEVATASLKNSQTEYMTWPEFLPWRDAKGRAQVINLGPLIPSTVFRKGNPEDSLLQRALVNSIEGFFSGGLAENGVRSALSGAGLATEARNPGRILPGDEGRTALASAWDYVEPGAVRDVREATRRMGLHGVMRKNEESLTAAQAAARVFPLTGVLRVEPVGINTQVAVQRADASEMFNLQRNVGIINSSTRTPEEKVRLLLANSAAMQALGKKQSQRATKVRRE